MHTYFQTLTQYESVPQTQMPVTRQDLALPFFGFSPSLSAPLGLASVARTRAPAKENQGTSTPQRRRQKRTIRVLASSDPSSYLPAPTTSPCILFSSANHF